MTSFIYFYFAIEDNHSMFCFSEGQKKYWREILTMIFELQSTVLKGFFLNQTDLHLIAR